MALHINESAENYLETILMLSQSLPVVRAVDIANELGFKKSSVSIAMKNLREKQYITVSNAGFITLTELKAKADNFGFSPATVALCDQQNKYFRSSVYVYENYTFATIRITSAHKKNDKEDCVAIYISKNFFLVVDIVDSDHSTKNSFKKSL